jgi:hypothetical protein
MISRINKTICEKKKEGKWHILFEFLQHKLCPIHSDVMFIRELDLAVGASQCRQIPLIVSILL